MARCRMAEFHEFIIAGIRQLTGEVTKSRHIWAPPFIPHSSSACTEALLELTAPKVAGENILRR